MSDVEIRTQDMTMLIFVKFLAKVGVDIPDGRRVMNTFADQSTGFYLWDKRLPVIVGVRKTSVIEEWASESHVLFEVLLFAFRFWRDSNRRLRLRGNTCGRG